MSDLKKPRDVKLERVLGHFGLGLLGLFVSGFCWNSSTEMRNLGFLIALYAVADYFTEETKKKAGRKR